MLTRNFGKTIAIIATLSAPLAAQKVDPQTAELQSQTQLFTSMLRGSVDKATERLGQWALQGGIVLAQGGTPRITATPLPSGSLIFDVQIPNVYGLQLVQAMVNNGQRAPRNVGQGGNEPKVDPQGLVAAKPRCDPADPMTVDGIEQYSECMHQQLVAGVLDAAKVLSVKDGQWLTVAANNMEANPIYANLSRRLILSIKGEDLRLLREGKITAEEAKKRIDERRF